MEWKNLTREQKVEWLEKQLKEVRSAATTIERFEKLTLKWLKRLKTQKPEK